MLPSLQLRRVVMLLDGTRDAGELLDAVVATTPPAERESLTSDSVQQRPQLLAENALLVE